jgi:hypothetical protein
MDVRLTGHCGCGGGGGRAYFLTGIMPGHITGKITKLV